MKIELLGSLAAEKCGKSFVPSAAKPRQVLALLAMRAGRLVPTATLMEELWGERPPRSASTTLQTYILQVRRHLSWAVSGFGLCPKDILVTAHGGYLLNARPGAVDAHRFMELVSAGDAALGARDDQAGSELLGHALRLWKGPALVDVKAGQVLEIEVMRLEEARLGVLEKRIGADLRLGRHNDIICELTTLAAQHPMHEGLHAQLMVAQYRAGRAWQALETYRRLRDTLDEGLGIAPSGLVKRLYHLVLTADPQLRGSQEQAHAGMERLVG
ncbi:BTAD domain-containing putative transcriptional regulator [Streptomyces argenteolus]|uniref:BTAD domain-containing putative transcriptional regulator n=1 Tax=Streptomyces argenteolus TaxID=67274 RepID=A0ABW6XBS7_9ACTN